MLAGAGLKKSDYSFVAIGGGAQSIQALTSKRVDAAAFPYPALRIDEVVGNLKFRYFYDPLLKDVSDVAYVASPATIATKAGAMRRFSRAIVKAAILIRVNPALAARYFAQANGQPATAEATANETRLLTTAYDSLPGGDPASLQIGQISLRDLHVLTKYMYDNGITSVLVPASAVGTNEFTAYANDFDHKAFIAQAKAMR
jgi:ABC-type nitrate/sulfonate/bicarbonate transport system substrate-binding protein